MRPSVAELLAELTLQLRAARVDNPAREARLLAAWTLNRDPAWLMAHDEAEVEVDTATRLRARGSARARRVPFAQLRGTQEFFGRDFRVSSAVLIPRPETEQLVTRAAAELARQGAHEFLELCTGTGCIAISLLAENSRLRAAATDLSPRAIAIARVNALRHGVASRLTLHQTNLWPRARRRWPLIIANPPYLAQDEFAALEPEVATHEPRLALAGGPDGLAIYRRIFSGAAGHLRPGGALLIEHGTEQRESLRRLAEPFRLRVTHEWNDEASHPRILQLIRIGD